MVRVGGVKYSGKMEMTSELSEVRAREVIGPEVKGDRMRDRKGSTMARGASVVRSTGFF